MYRIIENRKLVYNMTELVQENFNMIVSKTQHYLLQLLDKELVFGKYLLILFF